MTFERLLIIIQPSPSGFVSKSLTWEDPLQASQSLLEANFMLRLVLVNARLQAGRRSEASGLLPGLISYSLRQRE